MARFLHHRVRADLPETCWHWVETVMFAELCEKCFFLVLRFLFCRPSGSLSNSKNAFHFVPNGKVHDAQLFGLFVVAATNRVLVVTALWSVQPNRYVDEETTQMGGDKGLPVFLRKRAHEGERVTGQLSHNTLSTTHEYEYNGTWPTSKKTLCVCLTTRLCCKRSIAMFNALRACESWSIADPGR